MMENQTKKLLFIVIFVLGTAIFVDNFFTYDGSDGVQVSSFTGMGTFSAAATEVRGERGPSGTQITSVKVKLTDPEGRTVGEFDFNTKKDIPNKVSSLKKALNDYADGLNKELDNAQQDLDVLVGKTKQDAVDKSFKAIDKAAEKVDAAREKIENAVRGGKLTREQADKELEKLDSAKIKVGGRERSLKEVREVRDAVKSDEEGRTADAITKKDKEIQDRIEKLKKRIVDAKNAAEQELDALEKEVLEALRRGIAAGLAQ